MTEKLKSMLEASDTWHQSRMDDHEKWWTEKYGQESYIAGEIYKAFEDVLITAEGWSMEIGIDIDDSQKHLHSTIKRYKDLNYPIIAKVIDYSRKLSELYYDDKPPYLREVLEQLDNLDFEREENK